MAAVVGIDLGTSNSCVAHIVDGKAFVISDSEGRSTVPSVVAIDALGRPIVGHDAVAQQSTNRLNTIFAVKRLIGRKFDSEEVKELASKLPYKIVPSARGDAWVEVNGFAKSPEEISSYVLIKMKEVAEAHLKEPVTKAVITVPAHFNDAERQATKEAGRLAGLDVLRIINEPTAAALAYGMDLTYVGKTTVGNEVKGKKKSVDADRIIAVFDLGGGTFDITVLGMKEGVFTVLATHGDTYLGGEDFDLQIVSYFLDYFKKEKGMDLSKDQKVLQRLKEAGREAKHQLTYQSSVDINLPFIATGNEHFQLTINRKLLEKIVSPVMGRIEKPCIAAMEDANLVPEDISDVVLVGGMTRMPAVKSTCERIFNCLPHDDVNPDEAVALGAAIQGGLLQGLVKGVSFMDVTSLSLGIEIQGGRSYVLIPRNSKIPLTVTERFTTSAPNQPQIDVHVVQGENEFVYDNKTLGLFSLTGLRHAARGVPDIAVTFAIDPDGLVKVEAKDLETGLEQKVEISADSGLSDDELDKLLREQRMQQEQADRAKENAERRAYIQQDGEVGERKEALRAIVFTAQAKLNMQGKAFKGRGRTELEAHLRKARQLLEVQAELDAVSELCELLEHDEHELDQFIEAQV